MHVISYMTTLSLDSGAPSTMFHNDKNITVFNGDGFKKLFNCFYVFNTSAYIEISFNRVAI